MLQPRSPAPSSNDASHGAVDQLRAVQRLVEEMAGLPVSDASISRTPAPACPIARRRMIVLAGETAAFAAAGIEALIRHKSTTGIEAKEAAAALATDMRRSIDALERIGTAD